jgi:hypothetical protein
MSSETSGGEIVNSPVEVVQTTLSISEEQLELMRENLKKEKEFIEATRQLIKAGRRILELENPYFINLDVQQWERCVPKGDVVEDDDAAICSGGSGEFSSDHPALAAANREKYNFHVDGYTLTGNKVVISGWGDRSEEGDGPVSIFGCVIDITQSVQEVDVHIIKTTRETYDEPSDDETNLIVSLIDRLEKK